MSYFIIIRGPAGVGKSTISKRVAEAVRGCYVSFDSILDEHQLDVVPPGMDGIPAENFIKGNVIAIQKTKKLLGKGTPIIFDGCFYRKAQYEHLLASLPAKSFVFSLKAPVEECIKRDAARVRPIGEDSVRAVHSMVSELEIGVPVETVGKSEEQVLQKILSYLPTVL
jgi:predicted kinase